MGRVGDVPAEIQEAVITESAQIIGADTEADKEKQISVSKPEAVIRLAIECFANTRGAKKTRSANREGAQRSVAATKKGWS
jgi:hypothetical protein